MKWACGLTTVPERRSDLLPRTLASLEAAGFGRHLIRLFVDGDDDAQGWRREFAGVAAVSCHHPRIRVAGSWVLAAAELYFRDPAAERYVIFQDDFLATRNLRQYLERSRWPAEKAYLNLYTFPSNQTLSPGGRPGWFRSNQLGRGAVALVFDRLAMTALLSDSHLFERAQNPHRGHKAIDGGISEAMRKQGYVEYVHDPSLVQHVGEVSTCDNPRHPQATSWRGETFDALTLLEAVR